jgi:23S rRNA (uracil1939-C5)-methyltransferase
MRVDELGADGFGTGSFSDRLVRVKNALPGEKVNARVLKRQKGVWMAEAFEVQQPASLRIEPPCRYYPRCGGCAMQHMSYELQVELKQRLLLSELSARGVEPMQVNAPTLGPRLNYRTKARFGVRFVGGQVLAGFRESFSNRIGRMESCLTLVPAVSDLLAPLKCLIAGLSCPDRIPQVEVAAGDSSLALIIRHLDPLTDQDTRLIEEFAALHSVKCFGQGGGMDTVRPLSASACQPLLSYGNPDFGLHFEFLATDFTQVNLTMNRMLVRAALSGLQAQPGERVLDLFCGIGNFSLALAASGIEVLGLEASEPAIERARENAKRNQLECEFAVRDLYDPDCQNLGKAAYILLDPPRSGAGPNLLSWIRSSGSERIAYVSCSPASFADDASVLVQNGYQLEQVGVFDMFPHTMHVETLGIFAKQW